MAAPRYMARQWRVTEHDAHFETYRRGWPSFLAVVYFDDEPWQQPTMSGICKMEPYDWRGRSPSFQCCCKWKRKSNPGKI